MVILTARHLISKSVLTGTGFANSGREMEIYCFAPVNLSIHSHSLVYFRLFSHFIVKYISHYKLDF